MASDLELVSALHDKGSSERDDLPSLIFTLLVTAAAVGTYNNIIFNILKTIFFKHYLDHRKKFRLTAYQITNMTINLFLGVYGIYTFYFSLPDLESVEITARIAGFKEYATFGAIQCGYNIWALPVGFIWMGEPKSMLMHHIAVIIVAGISCFGTCGLRYHAPFFFGVIEISSVPLALMNFCKNNKDIVESRFPRLLPGCRITFSVFFVLVRVIMWTPLIKDVLYSSGLLVYSCRDVTCVVGVGSFWLSSLFLTILQYYWATLIVKGYLDFFGIVSKPKNKDKKD